MLYYSQLADYETARAYFTLTFAGFFLFDVKFVSPERLQLKIEIIDVRNPYDIVYHIMLDGKDHYIDDRVSDVSFNVFQHS